jgi:hypothetical protein
MTTAEKTKPFKYESEDQMMYVATCIAASNLGFALEDKRWSGSEACSKAIKQRDGYKSKADCILQFIGSLGDSDCDLYEGLLDERKGWIKSLKKDGFWNADAEKYIAMAQGE